MLKKLDVTNVNLIKVKITVHLPIWPQVILIFLKSGDRRTSQNYKRRSFLVNLANPAQNMKHGHLNIFYYNLNQKNIFIKQTEKGAILHSLNASNYNNSNLSPIIHNLPKRKRIHSRNKNAKFHILSRSNLQKKTTQPLIPVVIRPLIIIRTKIERPKPAPSINLISNFLY